MTVKTKRDQLIEILKEAEGATYTYFQINTRLGLNTQPIVEDLYIDYINEQFIGIVDSKHSDLAQMITLPLTYIDEIYEVEPEAYEIPEAKGEYEIIYGDSTKVYIIAYNEEE